MTTTTKVARINGRRVELAGSPRDDYYRALPDGGDLTDNVMTALAAVVDDDAVCLDVGANIGLVTLGLSFLAPRGRVYAFEPSPDATRWLRTNVDANGAANVEIHPIALGNRTGTVQFHDVPFFTAGSFTSEEGSYLGSDALGSTLVEVPCKTLDDFVEEAGIERVDVIKIDVEGGELSVLEGAARTLARHQPVVVMEFNGFAFSLHQDLLPQRALSRIQETFPHVFVIDRVDGSLSRLSTPKEAYRLLYSNGINGPTDNLLCSFEDRPVSRGFTLPTAAPALSPPDGSAAAELAAMRRTLSWRITAPLRAVRRSVDRDKVVHRLLGRRPGMAPRER